MYQSQSIHLKKRETIIVESRVLDEETNVLRFYIKDPESCLRHTDIGFYLSLSQLVDLQHAINTELEKYRLYE